MVGVIKSRTGILVLVTAQNVQKAVRAASMTMIMRKNTAIIALTDSVRTIIQACVTATTALLVTSITLQTIRHVLSAPKIARIAMILTIAMIVTTDGTLSQPITLIM